MLTVPYANAQAMSTGGDVTKLIAVLEKCALEMLMIQGSEQGGLGPRRGPQKWQRERTHSHQTQSPSTADMMDRSTVVCFLYREAGKCPRSEQG
jgi:hypothetical protein